MKPINLRVAEELGVRAQQVAAAISLLDGGATVPFVARYRKEATGALDDAQLRTLAERLTYLRELEERRAAIIDSISQQGKLDPALKQAIDTADSKARLEDLYLPLYGAFPVKSCFWFVAGSLFGAGKPFFVPSPAIRFAERAEGVKGPKR